MNSQVALDEYAQALRLGQKEYRELLMAGKEPHPAVLDEILPELATESVYNVGLVDIPTERIVGTKTAGRITAFTATFRPLLDAKSEFGMKWVSLCKAHLGDTGITDPIDCFEYLGNFYVQEGNKRVSVLRHFDAPRIPGNVRRVLPARSEEPRIKAYYEFLDFYKLSGLYSVHFRRPGDYAKLLSYLGKHADEVWTEEERRNFSAYFHYFQDAFFAVKTGNEDILPEEVLLLWLKLYPFQSIGQITSAQLKKSIAALWEDAVASVKKEEAVKVQTKAEDDSKSSIVSRIVTALDVLDVAFVHQMEADRSAWVMGHEEGSKHIAELFGDRIRVRSYYGAGTTEAAEQLIEQAVTDGAEVVFTTAPPLSRATLKAAVKYPKVRFLNCSVDQPYSSIRTYYGRIFEAKFITGAIAGAMARNDRIGYVGTYPIHGEPAAINAFALGAQLTNPRARIELKWSCLKGNPSRELFDSGIRVISNRDTPDENRIYTDYGTYFYNEEGKSIPLGSPVWRWGKFYEHVLQAIRSGSFDDKTNQAVNYWWGLKSGVIDVTLTDKLPEGIRYLAQIIRSGLYQGTMDPFLRRIVDQKGVERCDGIHPLTPDELVKMDWLCDNIIGHIPTIDEVIPESRATVNLLGVFQEDLP